MPGHGMSRWDGDVHYYDYTPETLRREPGRDALVVAEAFIYDTNKTERVAITVLASAQELHGIARDAAIHRGESVRAQAVTKYRAQLPTEHRAVLLDLTGREIAKDDR